MKASGIFNGNAKIQEFIHCLRAKTNKQNEQDRRIIRLKDLLRRMMGAEAFKAFYKTTSFNGDMLELQLMNEYVNQARAMIAARRVAFIKQIRGHNTAGPLDYGSDAWLAGLPDEDELGESPTDTRSNLGL